MPYASGRVRATIVGPVEKRPTGDRMLVSDPALRTEISLLAAKIEELLEVMQKESS